MPGDYPYMNLLGAYNQQKFQDPTHTSPKYTFLRAAAKYGTQSQGQRDALLAALRGDPSGYFKDAWMKNDILGGLSDKAFDGITSFDVIKDFGGANGIQWRPASRTGGIQRVAGTFQGPAGQTATLGLHDQQEEGQEQLGEGSSLRDDILQQLATKQALLQPRMY